MSAARFSDNLRPIRLQLPSKNITTETICTTINGTKINNIVLKNNVLGKNFKRK